MEAGQALGWTSCSPLVVWKSNASLMLVMNEEVMEGDVTQGNPSWRSTLYLSESSLERVIQSRTMTERQGDEESAPPTRQDRILPTRQRCTSSSNGKPDEPPLPVSSPVLQHCRESPTGAQPANPVRARCQCPGRDQTMPPMRSGDG